MASWFVPEEGIDSIHGPLAALVGLCLDLCQYCAQIHCEQRLVLRQRPKMELKKEHSTKLDSE
jgi:hypothetical protein